MVLVALISIFPALLCSEPLPSFIPANRKLASPVIPVISKFRALTAILPPPSAPTFTLPPLLSVISLFSTPEGKFTRKLFPFRFNPTVPVLAKPPNSTRPPKATNPPPSIFTSPPTNSKLLPSGTRKPLPGYSSDGFNPTSATELFSIDAV